MIGTGSRYAQVPTAVHVGADGRQVPYLRLRLVPPQPPSLQRHVVVAGDRLDRLAYAFYGDPEQFWRICDANLAVDPDDLLLVPGVELVVPLGFR